MTNQEMYASQIAVVKQSSPEAYYSEIGQDFERYEKEFLIPPEDALISLIRKLQASTGKEVTSASNSPVREEKKVRRFAELGADDRNATIEVTVESYTPRTQMVRGVERQIAFGWIEEHPWEASSERVRWDYKDWGAKGAGLVPG